MASGDVTSRSEGAPLVERDGEEVVLARTGYTGERGYEVFAPAASPAASGTPLLEAGGETGLEPCGLGARDVLRLEMGYPLYGQDLDAEHTTLEAGLGWAVSFDKGDFRGRDALVRQRDDGLPSRLRGLVTADRRHIPRAHQTVSAAGEVVGEITSGTFSPTLGSGIALGYLAPGGCAPRPGPRSRSTSAGGARRRGSSRRRSSIDRPAEPARPTQTGVGQRRSAGLTASIISGTEEPANCVAPMIRSSCCGARGESGTTATTT